MQRNYAVSEKVVAWAPFTGESRGGVTDPPVNKIKRRVITSCNPSSTAAIFPSIALPRLMPSFARPGNSIELPLLLAGHNVVCGKEAASTIIAASYPDDDRMVHYQRRPSKRITVRWARYSSLPFYFRCVRVNG